MKRSIIFFSLLVGALFASHPLSAPAQEAYEKPPLLKASEVVPKSLLRGPSYKVQEQVVNDGYLNKYQLRSRFGDLSVVSTALLLTRIDEIRALEKMEKLDTSKEFGTSLAQGGEQVVKGASNLLNDPAGSLGSAVSGVGKMFNRASEGLRSKASKHQDSVGEALLGVSKTKREYAVQFGVDPYSTNPILQKRLNEIAQAGQAGGITATALKAMVPGGIGLMVSAAGGTEWLKGVDLTLPPTELRMHNRDKLLRMGVSSSLAEQFINEDDFTPSQQSLLVVALDALAGVQGKDLYIRMALTTQDQDVALFRQRMAQMYAGYHGKVGRLARFLAMDRFVIAQAADGRLVAAFPLDHLVWTAANQNIVRFLTDRAKAEGASSRELWLTGSASPATRRQLKALGWDLHENGAGLMDGRTGNK